MQAVFITILLEVTKWVKNELGGQLGGQLGRQNRDKNTADKVGKMSRKVLKTTKSSGMKGGKYQEK